PALLEDLVERLALGVEGVHGERAEGGRRGNRAALVHRLGERRCGAAERLRLPGGSLSRRAGAVALRREHIGLGDLAARAGALDSVELDAVGLSGAAGN